MARSPARPRLVVLTQMRAFACSLSTPAATTRAPTIRLGFSRRHTAKMTDVAPHINGTHHNEKNGYDSKPQLELFVKASGIDSKRIGADIFCQEFWMELYALYEVGVVKAEVKTVNVNSEAFKRNFLGAQPPIMAEGDKIISDNREIESRIFKLAKSYDVSLFEKDDIVAKNIESLYRNFKLFLRVKIDHDKSHPHGSSADVLPASILGAHNKLVEQLSSIDALLAQRRSRYLLSSGMSMYDCELCPRLHHIRVVGEQLLGFEIPHNLIYLWNYILTAYRTAAFLESCPADQDIIHHYKEQLRLTTNQRETLQHPTKSLDLPKDVFDQIHSLSLS